MLERENLPGALSIELTLEEYIIRWPQGINYYLYDDILYDFKGSCTRGYRYRTVKDALDIVLRLRKKEAEINSKLNMAT